MPTKNSFQKVAAVTGATGAIGFSIAAMLAAQDFSVVLLTRNPSKSTDAVNAITTQTGNQSVKFELVNLSSHSSIKSLASSWDGPLHVLINNAAISPPTRLETPEGIELQFATNVLGYSWMMTSFFDILAKSAPSRVVNIASYWAGGLDLNDLEFKKRRYHNHDAYRQAKQANRMLTPVFAKKFKSNSITVNTCHPGDVNSALSNSLGFGGSQTPDEGAKTPVWLASSLEVENLSGKYFEDCQETSCRFGKNISDAQQLFDICQAYY